jgi:uncharacterized repeat protein (TIGR01451 family)
MYSFLSSAKYFVWCLGLILSGFISIQAQITGNVFRDFNANGIKDTGGTFSEIGIAGVTIKCVDSAGGTGTATSGATGDYTLSGCTGASRVEFTWATLADYSAPAGTSSNTSVQFVTAPASNVNFGLNYPSDYQQASPPFITPRYRNGTSTGNPSSAVHTFPFTAANATPLPTSVTTLANVGTLWGVAVQAYKKRVFMSAVLKRHSGLGPKGLGGVYVFDYNGATPALTGSFDLQGVTTVSGGTIDLGSVNRISSDPNYALGAEGSPNVDFDAFDKVGKVGFGDADMSEDGKTLWLVNLNQRALISVDATGTTFPGTNVNQYIISSLPNAPTCTNGQLRPYGLEFHYGKGYVGLVCTAEGAGGTAANLRGYVMTFNPLNVAAGLTAEVNFGMTYTRESIGGGGATEWKPWVSTWPSDMNGQNTHYAQPLVSDIEIDYKGDMTIGLLDRTGNQGGWRNYPAVLNAYSDATINLEFRSEISSGDIVKVCNVSGAWVLEGNAGCLDSDAGNARAGSNGGTKANDGLDNKGEFYWGDYINDWHDEIATGALAYHIMQNQMISTVYDPYDNTFTQGVHMYNPVDGTRTKVYQTDAQDPTPIKGPGKANGLGDIELLVNPAPLEIGNRVWLDTDKDGIQDPGEAGINGVTVTLMIGTDMVTTTTATVNGQTGVYYFKDGMAGLPAAWGGIIPRDAIAKIYVADTYTSGGTTYKATIANVGTDDAIDADGINMASQGTTAASVRIDFNTGQSGQNNHTYDFGYNVDTLMNFNNCVEVTAQDQTDLDSTPSDGTGDDYACATTTKAALFDLALDKKLSTGQAATVSAGDLVSFDITVYNQGTIDATAISITDYVDTAQFDAFAVADNPAGNSTVTVLPYTWSAAGVATLTGTLPAGASLKIPVKLRIKAGATGTAVNKAEVSAATGGTDIDSTPDGTDGNQAGEVSPVLVDDQVTGNGTSGGDEDDHDLAQVTISAPATFDLALDKKLSTGQSTVVNAGDLVSFEITVYNQGAVAATGISITDYVNTAQFDAFAVADNPAGNSTVTVLPYTWSAAGVATLTGTLPAGASLKIPVKLRIKAGATGTAVNKAEISAAAGGTDIDSTPDGTDGNQAGEVLPVMVDDQVTGNGTTGGDEDDHDLAQVSINVPLTADLELTKVADKTQVRVGDLLTYTLKITNKGPGTATAVKIKDTLPIGVSLQGAPVASAGTFDSATGVWTVGDLTNGAMATLTITVIVQ